MLHKVLHKAHSLKLSLKKSLGAVAGVLAGVSVSVDLEALNWLFTRGMTAGVLPGLASLGLFWGGINCIRLKRQIENTPTSKVRSIAMGMVEVHGRTRRVYALISPLTNSACAWYRIRK